MIAEHLNRILPILNDYLLIQKTGISDQRGKSDYTQIQLRIIRLLGRLGGKNISLIADASKNQVAVSWDSIKRLKLAVPLQDLRVELELDNLLPRALDLAMNSSDRQTKVAACEFIHSVVLFMLGNRRTNKTNKDSYKQIYKHLFPGLLKLATDVDLATRQLFEPLLFQLIHWFSRNSFAKNSNTADQSGQQDDQNTETTYLLDSIVDQLGTSSDGALREFCSKCLAEFLKYSIKQSSTKQQEKNPVHVRNFLKRLYGLARHPNPYKRLGAATTLLEILPIFREEQALIDQFVLEMMHTVIFSLRLCKQDEQSFGTLEKLHDFIRKLSKVIMLKSDLLNANSKTGNRKEHTNLDDFVSWLFTETGRQEGSSRSVCIHLFRELVQYLPSVKSA